MKELNIEEKAKRYDEALKRARYWEKNPTVWSSDDICQKLFPELKESEDEQSKKWILEYLYDGLRKSDEQFKGQFKAAIAWLEKQEGREYIKKDWLEHIKQSWYKEGFIDGKYTPKELTINDATTLNELIDFLENGTAKLQHDLTLYANWLKTQFSPNEKQGEQKPQRIISAEAKEALYDKPAWSEDEDDDAWMNDIISKVENNLQLNKAEIDWLKSLKQRIGGKQ